MPEGHHDPDGHLTCQSTGGASGDLLRKTPARRPLTGTELAFNILNVSSNTADLLPQARIRLAALELFGQQGFDRTTIRQIASRAGVSPGLVIHHFGSKKQLKEACDAHVLEFFSDERVFLEISGPMPSLAGFMAGHADIGPVLAYLVRILVGGGDLAQEIFDRFCDLSAVTIDQAEEKGLITMPEDRRAAIALTFAWSAGLMILGDLFAHHLGGEHLTDPDVIARYATVSVEMMTRGVISESYYDLLRGVIHHTM